MITILSIILLIFIDKCQNENPKSLCYVEKPFRTMENDCANFYDVCVKKDDMDCVNFQTACKQCPPSNYSVLMFLDLINVKNELIKTKEKLNILEIQSKIHQNQTKGSLIKQTIQINKIFLFLWIIIIFTGFCLVLIIVEVRFKLLTKICGKHSKPNYKILKSRKSENLKDSVSAVENFANIIEKSIGNQLNELMKKMEFAINQKNKLWKFKINDDIIEFNIQHGDTTVKVKKEICGKLSIQNYKNFKTMIIKYNKYPVDDNVYLLNIVGSGKEIIECEFDVKANPNEFYVWNIKSDSYPLRLIQIHKSKTILDLKNILKIQSNSPNDLIILKDKVQLTDKTNIQELNFEDETILEMITNEEKELAISDVFDDKTIMRISYLPSDSIEIVIKHMADRFNSDPDKFVLFIKNQYLEHNKVMYEYNIKNEFSVSYCCLRKLNGVQIGDTIYKGKLSQLLKAKDKHTQNEFLLQKYDSIAKNRFLDNNHIIKELCDFQITRFNERFVKLLNLYHSNNVVYLAMENMSEGPLKIFLQKHWPIEIHLIYEWSTRMLEGLDYLHKNKIILRDFNASRILVDEKRNIKLFGFNLSKYVEFLTPASIFKKKDIPILSIRYFAPELLKSETYDEKCDVWSFGAVLLKIATNEKPFSHLSKDQFKVAMTQDIQYNYSNEKIEITLKELMDLCFKPCETRASIEELKIKISKYISA